MEYKEALEYLNSYTWSRWKLGLTRTETLLKRLGNPQKKLKFIHVAGTNGKGSTSAMTERILREAGYRTGFYPSPHIEDFRERIRVNGDYITKEALGRLTGVLRDAADAMEDHPSHFELVTALGMLYFVEQTCDIVILETGLGGTMDSTNVIDAPEAAVITRIGLDHTQYLGETIKEIALAKAGIIKHGTDVVCLENEPEVMEVIRRVSAEKECRLHIAYEKDVQGESHGLDGLAFSYEGISYRLRLAGGYQLQNVSTVMKLIFVLREKGWNITEAAVKEGLFRVTWPARFEVLSRDPVFILDGGHNPQCADALADAVKEEFRETKITILTGVLSDKEHSDMMDRLLTVCDTFVCVTPDSDRALPAARLADIISAKGGNAKACDTIAEGVAKSLDTGRPVVAFGSLYMAGEVRRAFFAEAKKRQRALAKARRESLSEKEREGKEKAIQKLLQTKCRFEKGMTVLSYLSAGGEVDLSESNRLLSEQGVRVAYPMARGNGEMDAALCEEKYFVEGLYGIREPDPAHAKILRPDEIDVVFLPCVAFDAEGNRLGHGGGYFDRYLEKLRDDAKKILIAFDAQRLLSVVHTDHDIRADVIVTESGFLTAKEQDFHST